MAYTRTTKLLDAATTNTTTTSVTAEGVTQAGLAVATSAADVGGGDTATVTVEVSPDGTEWAALQDTGGTTLELTEADLDTAGGAATSADFVGVEARLRLSNFSDAAGSDFDISAWLTLIEV